MRGFESPNPQQPCCPLWPDRGTHIPIIPRGGGRPTALLTVALSKYVRSNQWWQDRVLSRGETLWQTVIMVESTAVTDDGGGQWRQHPSWSAACFTASAASLGRKGGGGGAWKRCLSDSYRVFACFIIHKFVTNLHKAAISAQEQWTPPFRVSFNISVFWAQSATSCGNSSAPGVLLPGQKTSLSHLQWRRRTALVSMRKIEKHKSRRLVWFMKWQGKGHLNGLISAGWISVGGAETFTGVSLVG